MGKRVLIMCTGNSCRSIIAEALVNHFLEGVEAYSCGVAPSGQINPNAKKVLQAYRCWDEKYYSKHLDEVIDIDFDLIVTVCDHARETCPVFPKPVKHLHIGFDDPDGKAYEAFEETYSQIKTVLLSAIVPQISK
jgi:arsenate reductase